jgi:hypothetical protein
MWLSPQSVTSSMASFSQTGHSLPQSTTSLSLFLTLSLFLSLSLFQTCPHYDTIVVVMLLYLGTAQVSPTYFVMCHIWYLSDSPCQIAKLPPALLQNVSSDKVKLESQLKGLCPGWLAPLQKIFEALRKKAHVLLLTCQICILGHKLKGLNEACKNPVIQMILGKSHFNLNTFLCNLSVVGSTS